LSNGASTFYGKNAYITLLELNSYISCKSNSLDSAI